MIDGFDPLVVVGRRTASTEAYGGLGVLTASTISTWPVTERSSVKDNPERYRSDAPADVRMASSGTTGQPMPSYRTWKETEENAAAVADAWMELLPYDRISVASLLDHNSAAAGLLMELVTRRNGWPLARLFPYGIGGPRFGQAAGAFAEFRPDVVVTTPSGLIDIEDAWRKSGYFEDAVSSVRALLLIGAPATSGMRYRLERAWAADAYVASYGSTELGTIATGCKDGRLHVLEGRHHLEIRACGIIGPLEVGCAGELIATPLGSRATVLVRYATGDTVSVVRCTCSGQGTVLVVSGRSDDLVIARNTPIGPEEVEHAVFIEGGGGDYLLEVDEDNQLIGIQVLPLADAHLDLEAVAGALGAPARMVDRLPPLARAGGAIKSWRRTRIVTIYREVC